MTTGQLVHTYTHTHTYVHVYVCVCICMRSSFLLFGCLIKIKGTAATEFPSFAIPAVKDGLGFIEWNGDTLGQMERYQRPTPLPNNTQESADWSRYVGGLYGGPLVVYGGANGGGSSPHPPAAVLSPTSQFDVGRLMHINDAGGDRVVGGVQGMITSLPQGYSLAFLLSGHTAGVSSSMVRASLVTASCEDDVAY